MIELAGIHPSMSKPPEKLAPLGEHRDPVVKLVSDVHIAVTVDCKVIYGTKLSGPRSFAAPGGEDLSRPEGHAENGALHIIAYVNIAPYR
ncbi:MAG: hypothetical protein NVS2B16_32780 [Chloroflexota bacterium]